MTDFKERKIHAERVVLCGMLLDEECIKRVRNNIPPSGFNGPGHDLIARAIDDLWVEGQSPDLLSLAARLQDEGNLQAAGGPDYIAGLFVHAAESGANFEESLRAADGYWPRA